MFCQPQYYKLLKKIQKYSQKVVKFRSSRFCELWLNYVSNIKYSFHERKRVNIYIIYTYINI